MLKRGLKPEHPGKTLEGLCINEWNLNVDEAAAKIGIQKNTLSQLVNERKYITPYLAGKLATAFGSKQLWLNLQKNFDEWTDKEDSKKIDTCFAGKTISAEEFEKSMGWR